MTFLTDALRGASATGLDTYRPEFFRLASLGDRERLEELLKRDPRIVTHDALHGQLTELHRSLNPSRQIGRQELDAAAQAHLGGVPAEEYGVWVHYPWSGRLVHLLDEQEFALVRTDRNRNKITRQEQALLSTKRIGVIGLSVGQSVALTLALERAFGELRLADFDQLELSNLNRIRGGVHQLGVNKAVLAAREIAEMDPFLRVTCFTEGITRGNIDRFLTDGGKLDILVEECDSVEMKILARQRAKAHRIAVVMDTNDRGMIDVERFDLEPDRPILHGLIDHLDLEATAHARTIEEKIPYLAPMAGLDHLSPRMKASMIEVGHTITSWPQLATSTVLGGALTGDVCRRIALDEFLVSGRWYVDMEALIGGAGAEAPSPAPPLEPDAPVRKAVAASSSEPTPLAGRDHGGLSPEAARDLAEAGAMAPSADNMQPWRFELVEGRLLLWHDPARSTSVLDPDRLIPHIGLGMCVENILLRAAERGMGLQCDILPLPEAHDLVAVFSRDVATSAVDPALGRFLAARHTNRQKGDGRPIPTAQLEQLVQEVRSVDGAVLHTITDAPAIDTLAVLQGAADRLRIMNEHGHREFFQHQLRWNTEEAERHRDGLDIATLELGAAGRVGMRMAAAPMAIRTLGAMGGGGALEKLSADTVRTSSAVVLLTMPSLDIVQRINGGRAAQRLWLCATAFGLAVHPLSAPIFLGQHARRDGAGFKPQERQEALDLWEQLTRLFQINDREPLFMVRLSYAPPPSARSLRRPLSALFTHHETVTT